MPFKNPHPLYCVWHAMKERCRNKNFRQWKNYGGRGISVCSRWLEPNSDGFRNFVADMGDRPNGYQLDRINNDGNYEPSNCRWASRSQQQRNQTVTRFVFIDGKKYIAAELAEISGIKTDAIVERAKLKLSYEEVISPKRRVYTDGLKLGGIANGKRQSSKTHCDNGHPFDEKNTHITKEGWRRCRRCRADRQAIRNKAKSRKKAPKRGRF